MAKRKSDDQPACASDIDLTTMTADEKAQWKKLRWVWCGKCGGGSINKVGWGHRKTHGDAVVSLAEAGKVEEAQREFLFIRRGGRAARAVVAKEKQSVEKEQQVVQEKQLVAQGKHTGLLPL